jgi:hypothetical protein
MQSTNHHGYTLIADPLQWLGHERGPIMLGRSGHLNGSRDNGAVAATEDGYAPLICSATPKPLARVPHPIPYQGSKRQLAHYIVSLFPAGTNRLVEPFAGSAAVSLAAGHMKRVKRWAINDLHRPLIDLWTEIVRNPDDISDRYEQTWKAVTLHPSARFSEISAI